MLSLGLITLKIIDTVLTPLHEPCYNHVLQCVYNYNDMHLNLIHACMPSCFSCIQFSTQCTVACQTSLSVEFSRQEYQSGLPCPPTRDLSNAGIKPACFSYLCLLDWQTGSLPLAPPGKPLYVISLCNFDEFGAVSFPFFKSALV